MTQIVTPLGSDWSQALRDCWDTAKDSDRRIELGDGKVMRFDTLDPQGFAVSSGAMVGKSTLIRPEGTKMAIKVEPGLGFMVDGPTFQLERDPSHTKDEGNNGNEGVIRASLGSGPLVVRHVTLSTPSDTIGSWRKAIFAVDDLLVSECDLHGVPRIDFHSQLELVGSKFTRDHPTYVSSEVLIFAQDSSAHAHIADCWFSEGNLRSPAMICQDGTWWVGYSHFIGNFNSVPRQRAPIVLQLGGTEGAPGPNHVTVIGNDFQLTRLRPPNQKDRWTHAVVAKDLCDRLDEVANTENLDPDVLFAKCATQT